MNVLGIIPARYASSRFPGKPLIDINGKTMIRRVYENSKDVIEDVIVATDSELIYSEVSGFGGNVVMTSAKHKSGTDRCAEAADIYENDRGQVFDVIVNIQGDEPFLHREHLEKIVNFFIKDDKVQISTLIKEINSSEDIFNPNKPKVVINKNKEVLYFSRSPIPYLRNYDKEKWHTKHRYFKHIGLYGYGRNVLKTITRLESSGLEIAEMLEQNRWLEYGYVIKAEITDKESLSVDTPEDLKLLMKKYF